MRKKGVKSRKFTHFDLKTPLKKPWPKSTAFDRSGSGVQERRRPGAWRFSVPSGSRFPFQANFDAIFSVLMKFLPLKTKNNEKITKTPLRKAPIYGPLQFPKGIAMGTSSKMLAQKLKNLAKRQHGCFTSSQAIRLGYADSVHLYHVRTGDWCRVFRGVYRFSTMPETPESRCMAALLWTRDKTGKMLGILHMETASKLKQNTLTQIMPIHVCVPRGFRRSAPTPDGLIVTISDISTTPIARVKRMPAQKMALPTPKERTTAKFTPSERPPIAKIVPLAPPERRSARSTSMDAADYYDFLDYSPVSNN